MAPCANSEIAAVSQIGHVLSCWIEQIKIRDAHLNLNVRHIFSCKGHFFVIIMRNARLREGGRTPGRGGGQNPISWPPREAGGRPYDGFTPVRISLENPQPSARLLRRGACGWPSKEGGSGGPEHGQRPFTEHPSSNPYSKCEDVLNHQTMQTLCGQHVDSLEQKWRFLLLFQFLCY